MSAEGSKPLAEEESSNVQDETLHIWLRDLEDTRFVWSVPGHPFAEVWPADEDQRWDVAWLEDLETPNAIRSLSGPGTPFKGRRGARVLQVALEEGFGGVDQPTTPEEILVTLYTAWVEAEVAYEQDWRAFEAEHLPEGLTRADLALPELRELYARPGQPAQDMSRLESLAAFALVAWPDHPLADHARLAEFRAARPYGFEDWDLDKMAELMEQFESPTLREQAALLVTATHEPTLELLDEVYSVEASTPSDAYRLASWGTARAVGLQDWDRATAWAERMRSAVETTCAQESSIAQSDCEFGGYQLRETAARLIALGYQEPRTWQEALTAAAWRCHLDEPARPGTSRTHATWTGERWEFEPWDYRSPVTTCLGGLGATEVVPKEPVGVRLAIETQG